MTKQEINKYKLKSKTLTQAQKDDILMTVGCLIFIAIMTVAAVAINIAGGTY